MQDMTPLRPVLQAIISNSGTASVSCGALTSLTMTLALTGVTNGVFSFEASLDSIDGFDGTWVPLQGLRSNGQGSEFTTAQLSSTPIYGWQFNVAGFNWFRVRASAGTFGTADVAVVASRAVVGGNTSASVQGAVSRGQLTAQPNPVVIGATGRSSNPSAVNDGRTVDLMADLQGRLLVKGFSAPDLDWQVFNANASPITTATTTVLKASIATFRQYVTALQVHNTSATPGEIVLQDTTGTPAQMWHMWLPASMTTPLVVVFPTPLRTGAGTASGVSLLTLTGGMSIYWSAQGYIAV